MEEKVIVISSKIVSVDVVDPDAIPQAKLDLVKKPRKRPVVLNGRTYAFKTQLLNSTVYVTINDILKDDGEAAPFELFIYCKDTRMFGEFDMVAKLLSAIFRKNDDICFVVENLKSENAMSAQNGYFRPPREGEDSGKFIPSVWYEIGETIEGHMEWLGKRCVGTKHAIMSDKLNSLNLSRDWSGVEDPGGSEADVERITNINKTRCPSCGEIEVVKNGGCNACLSCGWSKCG